MKRWEDKGAFLEAPGPVKLKRYRPGRLPNAAECVDCLIVINDDADGDPRPRVAISNGASWDYLVRGDQLVSAPPSTSLVVQPSRPSEIDITPMVRAAVEAALPAMIPQPVKVIEQIRHEPVAIGGEAGARAMSAPSISSIRCSSQSATSAYSGSARSPASAARASGP